MNTEDLSEEEFNKELRKYPVVRANDWRGVVADVQPQKRDIKAPLVLQSVVLDNNLSFWQNLNQFLIAHYPPSVAQSITVNFQNMYKTSLHSLSLDNIERLFS